jgi:hypothetical protein
MSRMSRPGEPTVLGGFAQVARWVARDSDDEASIYRKFGELSARNLFYIQAELLVLEKQLRDIDEGDALKIANADFDAIDLASTWEVLVEKSTAGNKDACDRMKLVMTVREKLKEYRMYQHPVSCADTD